MTPERVKELLPVLEAYAEGQPILWKFKNDTSWSRYRFHANEAGLRFDDACDYKVPKSAAQIMCETHGYGWDPENTARVAAYTKLADDFLKEYNMVYGHE